MAEFKTERRTITPRAQTLRKKPETREEKMIAAYSEANQALASVQDARMIKHEQLAEGVYQTTYEDGTAVIVNYNDTAYNGNGVTAEARNWSVRKGSAE